MQVPSNFKEIAHCTSPSKLLSLLDSRSSGLKNSEAIQSRLKWGANQIEKKKEDGPLEIFVRQFNILVLLLLFASLIALAIGHPADAVGILAAAFLSMIFGFVQEYKAEEALKSLYKLSAPKSNVLRDSSVLKIESSDLVCGDVVLLSAGDLIPADCLILEGDGILCDQSMLTGESEPIHKRAGILETKTPLANRSNILYSGTLILKGDCRALVFSVGENSEFGAIASRLSQIQAGKTPLAKALDELGAKVSKISTVLVFVFFLFGMFRSQPLADVLIVSVSLFVAAVPEGLPTVLAITLAVGVSRMAKEKAIVRKMQSVETMGAVTTICTDKTGTLTENRMQIVRCYCAGTDDNLSSNRDSSSPTSKLVLEYAALCSSATAKFSKKGAVEQSSGDSMEVAILLACNHLGVSVPKSYSSWKKKADFPFEFHRKMSSQIRHKGKANFAFCKGAPETILSMCTHVLSEDMKERPISKKDVIAISKAVENYASQALRTIAVAYRKLPSKSKYSQKDTESSLVFAGVLGIIDPPRKGVREAIELCQRAGIRVVMLTGDSPHTARAIASQLNIIQDPTSRILSGDEIEKMPDNELTAAFANSSVCARATPEHKFRIVRALQNAGEVVALTGDGVNDAPSIKKADIGIAMGIGGTDVARGAADMILTDNNFGTLAKAISRGRSIYENIRSFVRYQFTTNAAALILMFATPLAGMPLPLTPLQILWVNIIMDGPPALSLGAEPAKKDIMQNPPRDPKAQFLSSKLISSIVSSAVIMSALTLAIFAYYLSTEPDKALSMSFCTFVILQLANALNCRSSTLSAFDNIFANKYLVWAIVFCLLVQIAIVELAFFEPIFSTVHLGIHDWILIFGAGAVMIFYSEIAKSVSSIRTNKNTA